MNAPDFQETKPAEALAPGQKIGAFRLVRLLGMGGMGQAWLATGPNGRPVVVKTPRDEFAEDPATRLLFEDEGNLLSRISDHHWPKFVAQDTKGQRAFFVMEYVEGQALQEWLARAERIDSHIPRGILSYVLIEAAMGLHALHELRHKIGAPIDAVHRDVAPHNIMIERSGAVRMIDLGVAKSRIRRSENTEEGLFRGHLRYMAPEQALGAPPTRRMDVWGLGATLFAGATRLLPYAGLRDVQILGLRHEVYPILAVAGDIEEPDDVELFDVIRKATARNPDERFPTAKAFAEALAMAVPPSPRARAATFAFDLCESTRVLDGEAMRFASAVVNSDD